MQEYAFQINIYAAAVSMFAVVVTLGLWRRLRWRCMPPLHPGLVRYGGVLVVACRHRRACASHRPRGHCRADSRHRGDHDERVRLGLRGAGRGADAWPARAQFDIMFGQEKAP